MRVDTRPVSILTVICNLVETRTLTRLLEKEKGNIFFKSF